MTETNAQFGLSRLRGSLAMRELAASVRPSHEQMIQPLFVVQGIQERAAVASLNGVYRDTPATLLRQVESDLEQGVRKFLLFGVPQDKSKFEFEFTANQIAHLKKQFGSDIWLSTDVCLCSWTSHGHCGVLNKDQDAIDHQASIELLQQQALAFAQAGADCIAPSDMMDGRIGAIRKTLDQHGLIKTLIMSYAAKFHSRFYGPFRLAADSAPDAGCLLKDRSTYQISPANPRDALACAARDVEEGADIMMVKPGMPYLDILAQLSQRFPEKPWAVYQVSGEYGAIEVMGEQKLMNAPLAHVEAWTAFVRAGASIIITYGARNARRYLQEGLV